jgi:hypothetical protein
MCFTFGLIRPHGHPIDIKPGREGGLKRVDARAVVSFLRGKGGGGGGHRLGSASYEVRAEAQRPW